jgi:hypothetical protein
MVGAEHENEVVSFFFHGAVDELTLYDRALTIAEVQAVYGTGSCGKQENLGCVSLPAGALAWWRGEGTGADAVGGNTLALQNGAAFGTGRVGQSLAFDGTGEYASAADGPSLRPHNFTLEGWVEFNESGTSFYEGIVAKRVGFDGYDSYGIYRGNGTILGHVGTMDSEASIECPFTPTPGVWYHIAYVYDDDSDTQGLFVDGVQRASGTVTMSPAYDSQDVLLAPPDVFDLFSGSIDEMTLYDRALPASTIDSLYHAYRFGKCVATVAVQEPGRDPNAAHLAFAPTPFSGSGRVEFELAEPSRVELAVYDVTGKRVAMLVDRRLEAGRHSRTWDGRDSRGHVAGAGVYFVRLDTHGVRSGATVRSTVQTVRVR